MTEHQLSQFDPADGPSDPADLWRNEVQDRLARYQRRHGRRIKGAFTMRFPFPEEAASVVAEELPVSTPVSAASPPHTIPSAVIAETSVTEADNSPDAREAAPADLVLELPTPVEENTTFVDTVPRPRPKRKVIAFPKHLSVAPPQALHRLADPVSAEAPRILDVPEELEAIPATPFLDGLGLDPSAPSALSSHIREYDALPCQPVRVFPRLGAASIDIAVVLLGVAAFAAVAYKILEYPPMSKPLWLGLAAAVVMLWSAYQYLFLVHSGTTPGMMAARLRLRTFKGELPTRRQRQLRILSLYFSTLSLGMGLMWAFADLDGFCWHDRMSRTFLTRAE